MKSTQIATLKVIPSEASATDIPLRQSHLPHAIQAAIAEMEAGQISGFVITVPGNGTITDLEEAKRILAEL
jgi:hypothetical protein